MTEAGLKNIKKHLEKIIIIITLFIIAISCKDVSNINVRPIKAKIYKNSGRVIVKTFLIPEGSQLKLFRREGLKDCLVHINGNGRYVCVDYNVEDYEIIPNEQ